MEYGGKEASHTIHAGDGYSEDRALQWRFRWYGTDRCRSVACPRSTRFIPAAGRLIRGFPFPLERARGGAARCAELNRSPKLTILVRKPL